MTLKVQDLSLGGFASNFEILFAVKEVKNVEVDPWTPE